MSVAIEDVRRPTQGRILFVAPEPVYQDRGTPIAIRQMLEALSGHGWKIDLLTYPLGEPVELPGLRILRIRNPFRFRHIPIGFSFRKLILDMFLVLAFMNRLRKERYSLIHAVEEAAFPAVILARWKRTPLVYDMQSSLPENMASSRFFRARTVQRLLLRCERWLIRHADYIGCSIGLKDHVLEIDPLARVSEWSYEGQRMDVSAEEIDSLRRELNIAPDSRLVVYCGNFHEYQGVPLLLEAAERVSREIPEAFFLLVGGDGSELELPASAVELQKRGALRFISRQPRRETARYLALASVVVSPRVDGANLPLKIFDYLAAGRPIVATDCRAHRLVLNTERAVLVAASGEEVSKAILRLLRDPQEAERLGAAARTFTERQLGKQPFSQTVSALYRRAVEEGVFRVAP